jgi:plastocyanin
MLYREIIALCSEIHTKHINTLCGQNVEFVNVKLAAHTVTAVRDMDIVTTGLRCRLERPTVGRQCST